MEIMQRLPVCNTAVVKMDLSIHSSFDFTLFELDSCHQIASLCTSNCNICISEMGQNSSSQLKVHKQLYYSLVGFRAERKLSFRIN